MSTASRIDAASIITATAVAGCSALGLTDWMAPIPVETIGVGADILAGSIWTYHRIHHYLHGRKHTATHKATISISTDGAGRVIWSK